MTTGRIYINLGKDYCDYRRYLDFDTLIKAVACSKRYANGKLLVKKSGGNQIICAKYTKAYIASEATKLIQNISIIYGNYHMGLHVSKRQINKLAKVCEHKGNSLSCYSLVVLHIIYISINSSEREEYQNSLKDRKSVV